MAKNSYDNQMSLTSVWHLCRSPGGIIVRAERELGSSAVARLSTGAVAGCSDVYVLASQIPSIPNVSFVPHIELCPWGCLCWPRQLSFPRFSMVVAELEVQTAFSASLQMPLANPWCTPRQPHGPSLSELDEVKGLECHEGRMFYELVQGQGPAKAGVRRFASSRGT